ncbi:MAG: efflux transporter outer membrane subunit [Deltaproteobacteria bacterium]|nr:efflux transporter outer membrane subunit [Candidatus Deferrimicrobiaceae bacterium]
MRRIAILFMVLLAAGGCMVGPNYRRPTVDTPPSWRVTDGEADNVADTAWWGQFDDPVLDSLIRVALRENHDLQIAAARVDEFAGQYGFVRADLYPQVRAAASAGRQRDTGETGNPLPSGARLTRSSYSAALNASWELDLWGRIRRSTEAARAQLLGSEEGRRAVILSLVGSVAGSYINLRDLDRQLEIARSTAESRGKSLELFRMRFEGGVVSEVEYVQVKSQYEEAMATIPAFEKAIAQQENALCVLLGRNPGPIPRGRSIDRLALPAIPAGLPSELLSRRPDIQQAEQDLIAANAQIGVAKAAYYPSISLTGFFGFASTDLNNLFTGSAKTWSYSVPVSVPIFTAGKIAGSVKAAEAVQQQALAGYRKTIQNAFREVDDALVDQARTREQLSSQADQVKTLQKYLELAQLRFDNGYTSYLEVLDAERSLFNAQLSYVQNQGVLFQAVINVYKAMGGGWVTEADKETASSPPAR